ncbi:MAG: sugar phosphate isomerase/epimerase, partial [Microlunatus sp.]|nr:sugar phosphate isomerase/epimerase [Microlunatus sp.]
MFKVGFSTIGCPEYTVAQVADLARDSGYEGVELRFLRGVVDLTSLDELAGVQTLLETHDDFSTSDRVGLVLGQSSERLGVLWGMLHSWRHGEPIEQTYARLGDRIRQVHAKDSSVATPDGFDLVLTGTGIAPLGDLISILLAGGFDGYVDFEWEKAWHPEIEGP